MSAMLDQRCSQHVMAATPSTQLVWGSLQRSSPGSSSLSSTMCLWTCASCCATWVLSPHDKPATSLACIQVEQNLYGTAATTSTATSSTPGSTSITQTTTINGAPQAQAANQEFFAHYLLGGSSDDTIAELTISCLGKAGMAMARLFVSNSRRQPV